LRAAPFDTRLRFKGALGGALWNDRGVHPGDEKVHFGLVGDRAVFEIGSTARPGLDTV